jgi:peptidoglycan hydrolase-like protein with peptidoglycan-binding domain
MIKNILAIGLGAALLAVPFISSAATATPGASGCPVFYRSLYVGVSGSDVVALQQYLAAQGYFNASVTGYFGPITQAAVAHWQAQGGVALYGGPGSGTFGPLSRAYFSRTCGGSGGGGTAQDIRINAPAGVSLSPGGIAEIRNGSVYFTLQSLTASSATIQVTPVGCWNWFPSDPEPAMRCMIAIMPIAPQTLAVGQTYTSSNYSITLNQIYNGVATFYVSAK